MAKKATLTDSGQAAILDMDTGELTITAERYTTVSREPPFFKTPFNHDTDAEANAGALICKDPTKTQQHLAAEQDINNILAKFRETGVAWGQPGAPQYNDLAELHDLQDILAQGKAAEEAWNALPLKARRELETPDRMLAYIDHCIASGDIEPLRELGLAKPLDQPKLTPEPPKAPGGDTPAPKAPKEPPAPAGGST